MTNDRNPPGTPFAMNDLPDYISEEALRRFVKKALAEDVGSGDVTTEAVVDETVQAEGQFLARADGILAGLTMAEYVFSMVDDRIRCSWKCGDGGAIRAGATFGTAHGPARGLLIAERLVLNLMQRMSGIATLTHRFVDAVKGLPVQIMDTRKTAPGLRRLDKWAVRLGGGTNHRLGLDDMFLIKENHIAAAGGVAQALRAADRHRREQEFPVLIEVETRTLDEVREVLRTGCADRILLDNMVDLPAGGRIDVSRLRAATTLIDGRIPAEASGNVTLDTVRAIAETGVQCISCGALTHSVEALDISLQLRIM